MFDFVGRRRLGYLLSAILVTTGLLFILATLIPAGNVGLQFSIAYTGGTVWEVHFEDGAPAPLAVRAILEEQGLPGSEVAITSSDDREYVLIRTEALTLIEPQEADQGEFLAEEATPLPEDAIPSAESATLAATDVPAEPLETTAAAGSPDATEAPVVTALPGSTDAGASAAAPEAIATRVPVVTAVPESTAAAVVTAVPGEAASSDASASAAPGESVSASPSAVPDASASPDPSAAVVAGDDEGPVAGVPTEGEFGALAAALQEEFGRIDEVRQQESIGPVVSSELVQQTFLLIIFAALAIMAWISYRFSDFRMGVAALVALFHDVIITVGAFALLGTFVGVQVDALFVTAMLTVIGFSVHDTIVVFDRVRENRQRYVGEPIEQMVNFSIVQTVGRSLTTSLTLVLTLMALLLFGGEAIRPFTLALLIGVVAGTYSSIFVAVPLYLDWHLRDDRRKARPAAQPSPA